MAEQGLDYAVVTLCVPVSFARSIDPDALVNVKAMMGRRTKDELEKLGLVPLGRHPSPDLPGMMTISDPKVDRANAEIDRRKEERVKANQDRMRQSMKKGA